ncbi:MAG: acyltransferase [Prosthecobacter sp.]|nr:acyltransferase [Prosthecobacter sp.]
MNPATDSLKTGPAGIAIDLLRGLLALMVLLAHALESGQIVAAGSSQPMWMTVTLGHGSFWVNGFFVLSGFCIHRAILAQRAKPGPFALPYLWARVTRLYPVYLVALGLALLLSPWPSGSTLAAHLTMMQGITGPLAAIKPAWSLTYEVIYYAVWPLCLTLCAWRGMRALFLAGGGAVMAAGVLMLVWKKVMHGAEGTWVLPMALIAAQFPLWLAGAWLAERWDASAVGALAKARDSSPCSHDPRSLATAPTSGALALAGSIWVVSGYLLQAWLLHRGASTTVLILAGWLVVPGWLGIILGSAALPALKAWEKPARWLGLLSYPLYLLHQPLLDLGVAAARSARLDLSLPQAVIALLAAVMGLMVVAGVPLEKTALRWRADWLRRQHLRALKTAPA